MQADFITALPSGEHIVEAFAGTGVDLDAALTDACEGFRVCTFHVLCSALLGRPCGDTTVETWDIGGTPRTLTFGSVRIRGKLPPDSWPPVFAGIEAQVKASGLPPGLHWVRYFYCHIAGESPTIEVLLDDEPWTQLQRKAVNLPWPASEDYYKIRLFFIIQDR